MSICSVEDFGLAHRDLEGIDSIGIDEMAIGKGQDYITVVYQIVRTNIVFCGLAKSAKQPRRSIYWIGFLS
ncbi:MAG: hypothetical protein JW795_06005 [Chitinivibrionales bacterium]|nr:hypothetical protein [Chitinivibrionales bacterium]